MHNGQQRAVSSCVTETKTLDSQMQQCESTMRADHQISHVNALRQQRAAVAEASAGAAACLLLAG